MVCKKNIKVITWFSEKGKELFLDIQNGCLQIVGERICVFNLKLGDINAGNLFKKVLRNQF